LHEIDHLLQQESRGEPILYLLDLLVGKDGKLNSVIGRQNKPPTVDASIYNLML
jgi:hypothetical protein